jgi:DNA-binding NarL/FixJ family response regulator
VRVPERNTVTVVVGQFESLFGAGLELLLGRDRNIRLLASDVDDAGLEDAVARQRPRVVILGETVEYDLLVRLKANQSVTGVLVLAQTPSAQCQTLLLANGVSCVARSASVSELFSAIRLAAAGEPTFVRAGGSWVARRRPGEGLLTPRESEVFELLVLGWSYLKIGRALNIEPESARKYTVSICHKLNVAGKQELIGMHLPLDGPARQ